MSAKTYLVGGAVRDELMGRPTNDFDYVVVGATFDELAASYGDPVGADFPVFIDPADGSQYAMARRERKTGVGYHGFACDFGTDVTLEEDLSRRDLTINALAKDCITAEILDYFGGLRDIRDKVLRHVSDAFAEDPLRVVRLARFAARYNDFTIAPETRVLCQKVVDSGEMDALPFERYWLELFKAIDDGNVGKFMRVLASFGAFEKIRFFREVWGDAPNMEKLEKIGLIVRHAPEEMRGTYFVALTAHEDFMQVHAPSVLSYNIFMAVQRVERMQDFDLEQLMEFFKATRVYGESTLIDDVIYALSLSASAGHVTAVWPDELREMVNAVRKVTSQPYQHLKGKEIGEAMDKERRAIVSRLIEVF